MRSSRITARITAKRRRAMVGRAVSPGSRPTASHRNRFDAAFSCGHKFFRLRLYHESERRSGTSWSEHRAVPLSASAYRDQSGPLELASQFPAPRAAHRFGHNPWPSRSVPAVRSRFRTLKARCRNSRSAQQGENRAAPNRPERSTLNLASAPAGPKAYRRARTKFLARRRCAAPPQASRTSPRNSVGYRAARKYCRNSAFMYDACSEL